MQAWPKKGGFGRCWKVWCQLGLVGWLCKICRPCMRMANQVTIPSNALLVSIYPTTIWPKLVNAQPSTTHTTNAFEKWCYFPISPFWISLSCLNNDWQILRVIQSAVDQWLELSYCLPVLSHISVRLQILFSQQSLIFFLLKNVYW